MAKHVLRYVTEMLDLGLVFRKSNEPLKLTGYWDADWGTAEDRRRLSDYCSTLCDEGTLVSWNRKKQQCVALSNCEAEYMALAAATQEIKFLIQRLKDLRCDQETSVTMFVDNQG